MGCVTDITTTGDNDEPIFPESYYRHYLYCDQCGSFDLRYREELQEGFWGWLFRLKDIRGVRCFQCDAIYEFGSAFFTNYDENPRGFTMADVSRSSYRAFYLKGKTIGPVENA